MNATEKRRTSTCSTDNGSVHGHQGTQLSQVLSNESIISTRTKSKDVDPPVSLTTGDAPNAQARDMQQVDHTVATSSTTSPASNLSPAAAVSLNTLLVSGQRKSWRFDPDATVEAVRTHIWNNWPESWPQPKPESAAYLRLLHLGHILDNPDLTLASRGCKAGATTVVHIIIRSLPPPEPTKVEQESPIKGSNARQAPSNRRDEDTPGCSCVIC